MRHIGFLQNTIEEEILEASTIVPLDYTHSCAVGKTGSGKTSSYIYPNLDDRIKQNHAILLFDYKGKEHAAVKAFAKKHNRLSDVIEIGVPWGVKTNLIRYMNEAEIRKMTIELMGLNGNDAYWSTTSANIVVSIWKVIKACNKVIEASENIDVSSKFKSILKKHNFIFDLTFATFANITKTKEDLINFMKSAKEVNLGFHNLLEDLIETAFQFSEKDIVLKAYNKLTIASLKFKDTITKDTKPLHVFVEAKDDRQSTTFQTIILAMSTTFGSISETKEFNSNDVDLVQELNSKKIVVINTQELSSEVLQAFVNSLFNELTKRVKQQNLTPISIFIDEAQRVLNAKTDIRADVFREAKVELLLAFQNQQLLIDALGENKFLSLYQNLGQVYYFQNSVNYKEFETDKLDQFEYYTDNDSLKKHKASSIFLTKENLFEVQKAYFELNNVYENLNLSFYKDRGIFLFQSHLYKDNKIQILDENDVVTVVDIVDMPMINEAQKYISKIMDDYESNSNTVHEVEYGDEYSDEEKELFNDIMKLKTISSQDLK